MASSINPETLASLKECDEPGSNAFLAEIATAYIRDTTVRLKSMRDAHGEGKAEDLAKIAHTVKGSSLNIGADGIASLMQSIERDCKAGLPVALETLRAADAEFQRVKEELAALLG